MARPKTQRQLMNAGSPHQLTILCTMSAKRARKPLSEVSTNAVTKPKRRKLSAPKGTTAADADIDATVADDAAPKASSSRKTSNSAKPPAVTALPAEEFVPLHQAEGPGLYASNTRIPEGVEHTPYAYFSLF